MKQLYLMKSFKKRSKASLPHSVSIDAVVYKSTIYSPRNEFVIVLMIVTQIRIYRVDIEDSGSLEAHGYTVDGSLLLS